VTHPVWSVDANDWRPIGQLHVGERLKALSGEPSITAITVPHCVSDVFNLEIEGDHVYRLLSDGILVHNANYGRIFDCIAKGRIWSYADDDLAAAVLAFRKSAAGLNVSAERNVAIARLPDGTLTDPLVSEASGIAGHAERQLESICRQRGTTVVELFSERIPCTSAKRGTEEGCVQWMAKSPYFATIEKLAYRFMWGLEDKTVPAIIDAVAH
jgi:hypothetical protein